MSIGQYVTQDIFASYEFGMGKGGGNRVGIEYSITPRLKLKGSTNGITEPGHRFSLASRLLGLGLVRALCRSS